MKRRSVRPKRHGLRALLYLGALFAATAAEPAGSGATEPVELPRVFLIDAASLAQTRCGVAAGALELAGAVARLHDEARTALAAGPFSVTDKKFVPPSGDKHDYMSLGPYWWPDTSKPDGLPYVRRDGEVNPEGEAYDREPLGRMTSAVETLALAYYLTGHEPYAEHAARLLRAWFLEEATRMNPHLEYGQAIPGRTEGRGIGIIDTAQWARLVDAVGMLGGSSAWTAADQQGLEAWFRRYLTWLRESKHGHDEARAENNHGTWYDVQVAAFAMFVGEEAIARDVLQKVPERRIATQIEPDGRQPLELARTRSFDYSAMNLRGMFELATLGQPLGVDLWSYETADGRSIRRALDWLIPYATGEKPWEHRQIGELDPGRVAPLLRRAAAAYREAGYQSAARKIAGDPADRMHLIWPEPTFESPAVEELIRRAGNADSDSDRLAILKQIRALPELAPALAADADKLIAFVEKWVEGKSLHFYSREVSRNKDVDFGIATSSPLYPVTYLYRGRAVLTVVMQNGNLWSYPDRRREWFGIARGLFEKAHEAFPENRIARMYLGEGIPWTHDWEPVAAAPQWAVQQRVGLEGIADIILWWIDNRQQEDGDFGGGWGDDCEMWRWWVPVLVGFDDPKIRQGQARFSEAIMSQPHMAGGYMSGMTDVEHSAEDSTDAILPMMHLDPENPVWQQRALRLAELMKTLWTGRNERGLLQFKSTYFTVDRVHEDPQKACDTPYHVRAVQPALLYWLRTGDPQVGQLLSDWMRTWVDAAARSENGKPAGILPAALHWPEGTIGGLSPHWWDPQNHGEPTLYQWPSAMVGLTDALLLCYHMTGDEEFLAPLRSMARIASQHAHEPAGGVAARGSEAWCAGRMGFLAGTLSKYRLLTGDDSFDRLLEREGSPMLPLRLRGDRGPLVAALTDAALAFSYNFERYTSEVRYTDRVLRFPAVFQGDVRLAAAEFPVRSPDPGLLYSTVTGDPAAPGSFPMNAVRWLTRPREIAVLVTDAAPRRFEAELFHFGQEPRPMGAELYLLAPGQYRLALTAGTETLHEATVAVSGPHTRVAFELPSRQVCGLALTPR